MDKAEEEFLKELISTFRIEAKEHLTAITNYLIELEKAPKVSQMGLIENISREAHSLKGAARSVNMKEIESLCQAMENVFSLLKQREIGILPGLFDVLHKASDAVAAILSVDELTQHERALANEHILNIESMIQGKVIPVKMTEPLKEPEPVKEPAPYSSPEIVKEEKVANVQAGVHVAGTVRISTEKLDMLLLQAEELLSPKLSASQLAIDIQDCNSFFKSWNKEWARLQSYLSFNKTREASPVIEFLEWNRTSMHSLEGKMTGFAKSAESGHKVLGMMIDNLLHDMKKILMLPFSSLFDMFPKLVRDLSREQGKLVDLVIEGREIEIDRRIMEEMKDPLIHLFRNSIDHGIEEPEVRVRKNKPEKGTIKLSASSGDGKVEILFSDDGTGIDASLVKATAIKKGIISQEEASKLSEYEAASLIFHSGFSTSKIITEISGRGLGLAIVREKVEKLNGRVSFETKPDAGTTFRIVLPLTLSTFRGLLVEVGEHKLVFPAATVEKAMKLRIEDIKTVEDQEVIVINGQVVSLFRLGDMLGLPIKPTKYLEAVVAGHGEKFAAFMVDRVLNEQEVLVKGLGNQLSRVRNIAGSTVLGNGEIALILNVQDMMKFTAGVKIHAKEEKRMEKKNSILIADDSVTARTLLKNILESAGYEVKTAVDGMEAFSTLKTGKFNLLVSDVEMPRMNGFALVSKIRDDSELADLPVVLVTGLESREDKEKGIEVGANAYIVKSSFDQSDLLEVIRRLI